MTTYTKRFKHKLSRPRGMILTDAFDQVLVGESEDEILIYQEETFDYNMRSKNSTIYIKRIKH
jgi:hypothetical protein